MFDPKPKHTAPQPKFESMLLAVCIVVAFSTPFTSAFNHFIPPQKTFNAASSRLSTKLSIVPKNAPQRTKSLCMQSSKAELNEKFLWRIDFKFIRSGCKDTSAVARVRFVQDRSYEPPQGRIFVQDDFNGLIKVDERGYAGTWTLSEDKTDRKDGLWICE